MERSTKYKEAAEKMKLTAKDLYELKIIDKIISEPEIMSEEHFNIISNSLKEAIIQEILKLKKLSEKEIVENRYQKFRKISGFMEV